MSMRSRSIEGFALVMALLIVAIIASTVLGSLLLSGVNARISSNDATSIQALNVAQAGNAYWKAEIVSLYRFMIEHPELYEDAINEYIANGGHIVCGNYLALGLDLDRNGTIDIKNVKLTDPRAGRTLPDISVPVDTAMGRARVTFAVQGSTIELDSRGTLGTSNARVVESFALGKFDVWSNAVFAQEGAANATVQGRAEIRGSIHILGEGLNSTSTALDVSGSFGLGNTYRGLNSSLDVTTDGMRLTFPDPEDLCATLRVKNGRVLMGGSSTIGYPETANVSSTTPDTIIDNMRGVYTNHGFVGGTEGVNIHSQNGMGAAYDVGNGFSFPRLNDFITVPSGTSTITITRKQQLERNALKLSTISTLDDRNRLPRLQNDGNNNNNNLTSSPSGWTAGPGAFYLSGSCNVNTGLFGVPPAGSSTPRFTLAHSVTPAFTCRKYRMAGSSANKQTDEVVTEVEWNPTTNTLYVGGTGGVVMFDRADLLITSGGGSNTEIVYYGNGVLFAESNLMDLAGTPLAVANNGGNIILESDFLPAALSTSVKRKGNGKQTIINYPNTYPATTVIGLVARDKVVSQGAQKRLTVAMYAQERVSVTKQTLIAGAIVTKTFDAGSQVPTVLYVPNLAESMPKAMPGVDGSNFSVSNVSWSRR